MYVYIYICVYAKRDLYESTETFKGNLRMRSSPVMKLDIQTQRQDKKRKTDAHIMIPEMSCLTRVRKCFAGNSMKAKRSMYAKRDLYVSEKTFKRDLHKRCTY